MQYFHFNFLCSLEVLLTTQRKFIKKKLIPGKWSDLNILQCDKWLWDPVMDLNCICFDMNFEIMKLPSGSPLCYRLYSLCGCCFCCYLFCQGQLTFFFESSHLRPCLFRDCIFVTWTFHLFSFPQTCYLYLDEYAQYILS